MSETAMESLVSGIAERFAGTLQAAVSPDTKELTIELGDAGQLIEVCESLRDDFGFEMLIDLAGVDYLGYGVPEWQTEAASTTGFGRARSSQASTADQRQRFAVVYHFLSIRHNRRARLRVYCPDEDAPIVDSVIAVWPSANWYEREAFDLFGIMFDGHPDLRRILTDYGFIGHPFRKDFPLIGNVEVRYDPDKGRVVYQPVSIEPRTLVPKVIRDDNRYSGELTDRPAGADDNA